MPTDIFACHSVWIGPNKIPIQAALSLYTKALMYTQEHHDDNGFIPTVCFNKSAVENLNICSVPLELVNIDACPVAYAHIKNAAEKLKGCRHLLKINPYCDKNIAYIPVFIWEDLNSSIYEALHAPDLSDPALAHDDML